MENKESKPIYEHTKVMDMITPAPLHIQIRLFELASKDPMIQCILGLDEKLRSKGFCLERINLEDIRRGDAIA